MVIKNRYAIVYLVVDDVRDHRPEWTIKRCAEFLDKYEESFICMFRQTADKTLREFLYKEKLYAKK